MQVLRSSSQGLLKIPIWVAIKALIQLETSWYYNSGGVDKKPFALEKTADLVKAFGHKIDMK